jgi:hypothetical protein
MPFRVLWRETDHQRRSLVVVSRERVSCRIADSFSSRYSSEASESFVNAGIIAAKISSEEL